MEGLAGLKPSFEMPGQMGFDDVILAKYNEYSKVSMSILPGTLPASSTGLVHSAIGSEKAGTISD